MVDTVPPATRSRIMARIRSKDTKPEMLVRRLVFNEGYRYRLHAKNLPGAPDLVFFGRKKVIFVNGCFWHRHELCRLARLPKSRSEFWHDKLERNRQRDCANAVELERLGWKILTLWECELADRARLRTRIIGFLGPR